MNRRNILAVACVRPVQAFVAQTLLRPSPRYGPTNKRGYNGPRNSVDRVAALEAWRQRGPALRRRVHAFVARFASICVLALLLGGCRTPVADRAGRFAVTDLRCEYLVDPLGLDEREPRLSWRIESTRRGARQLAYQVLVASSREELNRDRGDLWDSGRVESPETSAIDYRGAALRSGQVAWWKIRAWDESGAASGWSASARWEMALLDEKEWQGSWIGLNADTGPQPLPLLRQGFSLPAPVKRARAYVTGLGYYELRLNGRRVGDHVLAPGYTRYDRRVLFETYDVTALLRRGDNVVGALLGNGWYNVQTATAWDFNTAPWRASPRFRLELRIELADGREVRVASGPDWKVTAGPITFSSIFGGETYDARREQPGWDAPGFDDRRWQPAEVLPAPKGRLVAQAMPPIRRIRTIQPVRVSEPRPGTLVYDFGESLAGVAELRVRGQAGEPVVLKYGEQLAADGTLERGAIGAHVWRKGKEQAFQQDTYLPRGEGEERWHARFTYHGFRYVEVTGLAGGDRGSLQAHVLHSDVPSVGQFSSSNEILNRTWENARRSYTNNLHGIFTDCPHREKNGWTGDTHLACEFGLLNYGAVPIYEKWINDVADEQRPDGDIPGIVPTPGWGYTRDVGPAWQAAYLLVPQYVYLYYGDARMLRRHYEGHRRYVDWLTAQKAKAGIVSNGIGDWLFYKTETPAALTSTAYYYSCVQIVARSAELLGRAEDAARYQRLAAEVRQAFNGKFLDPQTGRYATGSQTAQAGAIFQGLVAEGDKPAATARLLDAVAAANGHVDTGLLGARYVPRVLTEQGHAEVAYRMVTKETLPGWGYWVKQGASTLWEYWDGRGSRDHPMYADVAAWFVNDLAGIAPDPAVPGFRQFVVKPHPVDDLRHAEASYDSVRGRIESRWRNGPDGFRLEVHVPANTSAVVSLPASDAQKIRESGKPLSAHPDFVVGSVAGGRVEVRIGSGDYRFDVSR